MSRRALIVALAVSVGLNLFAAGAGLTLLLNKPKIERRLDQAAGAQRRPQLRELAQQLPEAERERVLQAMRASGLAARPDFDEARRLRLEAVERARGGSYDASAVLALLDRSRAAERRGRERVEGDLARLMSDLSPEARAALAPALARSGGSGRRGRPAPSAENRPG